VPAYGSQASAARIYAPAVVPTPQDAAGKGSTGDSFPIPVDFFTAYQIARPTTRAIRATADISTAAYQQDIGAANQDGMPTHQQRHAAADEKRKEIAQLLSRMPHLSRIPETAEMAANLHSLQVQPHLPCTALHARMPNLSKAKGYKESNVVSGAAQIQPIKFHGFAPPIIDTNTATALLYGAAPRMVGTIAASHTWSAGEAAASQQALDHSAYAPYPAAMLYDATPYWLGTKADAHTFSPKRPRGSQAAAPLHTVASTPDAAAMLYSAAPGRCSGRRAYLSGRRTCGALCSSSP
jgi:hypothetical protein